VRSRASIRSTDRRSGATVGAAWTSAFSPPPPSCALGRASCASPRPRAASASKARAVRTTSDRHHGGALSSRRAGHRGERPARRPRSSSTANRNIAVCWRVPGLAAAPLPFIDPHGAIPSRSSATPKNGPFDARPGASARPPTSSSRQAARGDGLSGVVRHGNSGGRPSTRAPGRSDRVRRAIGASGGYGVPQRGVRADLARAKRPVSTGSCG